MAIRALNTNPSYGTTRYTVVEWTGLLQADTGAPLGIDPSTVVSVQIKGTAGVGLSVQMETSLDGGTTWAICNDIKGTDMVYSAVNKFSGVGPAIPLLRPNVTGGDGATSLTVIVLAGRWG